MIRCEIHINYAAANLEHISYFNIMSADMASTAHRIAPTERPSQRPTCCNRGRFRCRVRGTTEGLQLLNETILLPNGTQECAGGSEKLPHAYFGALVFTGHDGAAPWAIMWCLFVWLILLLSRIDPVGPGIYG